MKKKIQNTIFIVLFIVIGIIFFFSISRTEKVSDTKIIEPNFEKIVVNDQLGVITTDNKSEDIPTSFKKIAENDQLELFVEEETIAIAIVDKTNGTVWASYDTESDLAADGYSQEIINYIQSGISITTYDGNTPSRRTILDAGVEKEIQQKQNGVIVTVDFTLQKIKFDVSISIQGGDLLVHIPADSVEEYNENLGKTGKNNTYLNQITIFPFLGSTEGQENGYVVIPDGAGVLVNLSDIPKSSDGYSGFVYGKDNGYENNPKQRKFSSKPLEHVTLPIYGIIHDEGHKGLLVIAENGESYATYNYRPKNTDTRYYQSYFTYTYRTVYAQLQSRVNKDQFLLDYQEKPNSFDLVQRYVFLEEQADYVGVAKKYRSFLEKKYDFEDSKKQNDNQIPMKIDFITNEMKEDSLGLEEVVLTTYENAAEVVNQLQEKGYTTLDITFKTFNKEKWQYGINSFNSLGGKNKLREVLDGFKRDNVDFNYYVDYSKSYFNATQFAAYKMNRSTFTILNSENEMMAYLNNPKYYSNFIKKDIEFLNDFSIDSLAVDGLNTNIFTHFDQDNYTNSLTNMANTSHLLEYLTENEIKISLYSPNAYLYPYLNKHFDTPYFSSNLSFADETVPLLQLILSGQTEMYSTYLNNASNDQKAALKLIEFGLYPSFLMTDESAYKLKETPSNNISVSEYRYLENRMENYYQSINSVLSEVIGEEMVDHKIVEEGIVNIRYSNGKTIWINYNDRDYKNEEIEIERKGVIVK